MSDRRKLLGAVGSALLTSFAGCANVVEETADGPDPTTTEAPPTSYTQPNETTAQAMNETTGEQTTAGNSSEGNVSRPGDADGTTDEEALGRVTIEKPAVKLPKSLVPSDPGRYDYARLGSADADATAVLYGNWKCPYTQEFVLQMLGDVVEEFVKPGDVALEFRALSYLDGEPFLGPDAPRAARAGLEVWNSSPRKYWQYFSSVFTNQPPEKYDWATPDRLSRFAKSAGVKSGAVENALLTGAHRERVRATTKAAAEQGIATVPRVVTDAAITAPTVDFAATKRQLRRATDY
ncbi:DsbA family protein [Halorussus ruber]|uniref:DsbA family protein n=1 Tax=Halorussus ruber TaxID=1126238 RepID=UPI0010921B53|nr:thioredoxin domain-containing protein [Halorussus ruber]